MFSQHGFRAALATGLIGLLPFGVAAAQGSRPPFAEPSVVVSYADLDLGTRLGAEKLYERIEQAAAQLCPRVAFQELPRYAASLRCRNEVVAHAVSSINSAQLAAVYALHTHHLGHSAA
jgi:UrcA family protein